MKIETFLTISIPAIAFIAGAISTEPVISITSAIIYLAVARLSYGSPNYGVVMLVIGEIVVITASSYAVMLILQILVAILFINQKITTEISDTVRIILPAAVILSAGAAISATQDYFPSFLILLTILGGMTFITLIMRQRLKPRGEPA